MDDTKKIFMVMDDTVDVERESFPIDNENNQKIHDELLKKYRDKYLK